MPFVSITRLRLRSRRFILGFAIHAWKSLAQTRKAKGYLAGSLLADRKLAFWTMTSWHTEEDMRRFMASGAHAKAMPKLRDWCDEASVVGWIQEHTNLPQWAEADQRMEALGRPSKVRNPSLNHESMTYDPPQRFKGVPIGTPRT